MIFCDKFRKDLDDIFKESGLLSSSKLNHTPFIVFDKSKWRAENVNELKRIKEQNTEEFKKEFPDIYRINKDKEKKILKEMEETDIKVTIVDNYHRVLEFPPYTKVMVQWRGQWRSDFFCFEVIDLEEYLKNNPKEEYDK